MPHETTIPQRLKDFFNVPAMMRGFYLAYGVSLLAATIPAVLIFFYIRDVLDAESQTWLFLGLYVGSGVVALPLWLYAAKQFGQSGVWLAAMALSVLVFSATIFLGRGDVWAYGAICVGAGLSFGVEFVLPPMILRNLIVAAQETPRAASRYALLAFLGKAALVIVCIMVLPALDYFGFKPEQNNAGHVVQILSFCYAVLPCLIKGAAIFIGWQWMKTYGGYLEKTHASRTAGGSHVA